LLAAVRRPANEGPGDTAEMAQRRRAWEQRAMRRDSGERAALQRYLDVIAPLVPAGATVLDLGCGTGLALQELGQRISSPLLLVGLDISKPMLNAAYRTLRGEPHAVVLRASSRRRLPFRDAAGDVVMRRLAPALPAEVVRVLKPGGAYVVASFGPAHWQELYDLLPHLPRPQPPRVSVRDQLASAGLAHVESHAWQDVESIPAGEALERVLLGPAGFHVDWARDLPELRQRVAAAGGHLRLTTHVQVSVAVKG
jgi:SAM-dependent methyltransferase